MTRDEWKLKYVNKLVEVAGPFDPVLVEGVAEAGAECYFDDDVDVSPEDAALEEVSCWSDDGD